MWGGRSREMAVLHSPLDLSYSDTIRDPLSSLCCSNPSLTGEDSVVKSEEGANWRMGVPRHTAYGLVLINAAYGMPPFKLLMK